MTHRFSTPPIPAALLLALVGVASQAADTRGAPSAATNAAARPYPAASVSTADALTEVQDIVKAGRAGEAMRRIDVLVAARPTDPRLLFQKGVMLVDQKRDAEAIQVFQKLMRDYPALPEPMNNLAVLYVERGEMERARTTLEAAIRSKPNYGTAFQNLGDLYTRMASRAYARALQIDEADASPKLALIRSLYEPPRSEADVAWMAQAPTSAPLTRTELRPAAAAAASAPPVVTAAATTPSRPASLAQPTAKPSAVASAANPTVAVAAMAPASANNPSRVASSAPAAPALAKAAASAAPAPTVASATTALSKPPHAPAVGPLPPSTDLADVNAALRAWTTAWSRRDMPGYIGAYVPGFKGSDASADAWQAARRARILGKASIRVDVSGVKVEVDKGIATASFRQAYVAGGLEVNSRKTLEFVRLGGKWLIRRESVGG